MTDTTIENYQERTMRTMTDLGSKEVDGAHMIIGMVTEVEEMKEGVFNKDKVNIREEHGDCNWYIANTCNIYDLDFKELYAKSLKQEFTKFSLGPLADLHKRELAYGKEMDVDLLEKELVKFVKFLSLIAASYDFEYEESLQININKLYKRYPEKFSNEAALNRDLDEEYKTLT
jgi:NTP pyrophosphatase (non-canonical NTP hydrolase)